MEPEPAQGIIGKALRAILGAPPYFGQMGIAVTRADSVAIEAANSPKSLAEVKAERAQKSDIAIEHLRREIHH